MNRGLVNLCAAAWAAGWMEARGQELLSLEQAVRLASERHPAVRESSERAAAARGAAGLARTAYIPQVSVAAQVNRATTNNVYGMLFQQPVIPPITGPPVRENRSANVFGSALGVLLSWEPFDFGFRKAEVDAAAAAGRRAEAARENTKFEAGAAAADAFLAVLAAEQEVKASEAGLARSKALHTEIRALAEAGLRPGADEARARAEVAEAENQRTRAAQGLRIAGVTLAESTGSSANAVSPSAGPLLGAAPGGVEAPPAEHPRAKVGTAAIEEVQARERVLERAYFPKFAVQGAAFSRGTGARPDFTTPGGANGLAPTFYNWGLGFTATLNLTEAKALGERRKIEAAGERAERARLDLVRQTVDASRERAKAMLDAAREIERNGPVELEAARAAEQQASARYRAGLGTLLDVVEAQRLLTGAEIGNALARLGVWRGLLAVAIAQGDLEPFLKAAK